jgi:hypothetical protein
MVPDPVRPRPAGPGGDLVTDGHPAGRPGVASRTIRVHRDEEGAELTQLRDEIDRLDALRAQPPGTPGGEGADAAIVAARAALGAFDRAHRVELAAIERRRAQAREEGRARFEAGLTRTRAEAAMRALELRLGYHSTMHWSARRRNTTPSGSPTA